MAEKPFSRNCAMYDITGTPPVAHPPAPQESTEGVLFMGWDNLGKTFEGLSKRLTESYRASLKALSEPLHSLLHYWLRELLWEKLTKRLKRLITDGNDLWIHKVAESRREHQSLTVPFKVNHLAHLKSHSLSVATQIATQGPQSSAFRLISNEWFLECSPIVSPGLL